MSGLTTVCLIGAAALPACLQAADDQLDETVEAAAEDDSEISSGVFDVGVIPDLSVAQAT